MLRKDLIMRQLEEFGKVMAVILGFKKQQDWEKFREEITTAGQKFTSLNIEHIESLSDSEFENEILNHPTLVPDQYKILADLLFEKMEYYANQNNKHKYSDLKTKCTMLYQKFSDNLTHNEFNLDVHYKMELLKKL